MKIQFYADNQSLFRTILEGALRNCDINHYRLIGREILLEQTPGREVLRNLEKQLLPYGFDVARPERVNLAHKISDILADVVYNDESLSTNLSTFISDRTGMSYSHAARIFSSELDCSIEEFYISKKIERAKQLIAQSELTFKEIAYKLGYCSLGHLSKQFKKYAGVTLTYYRAHLSDVGTEG